MSAPPGDNPIAAGGATPDADARRLVVANGGHDGRVRRAIRVGQKNTPLVAAAGDCFRFPDGHRPRHRKGDQAQLRDRHVLGGDELASAPTHPR